jgi:hypothetical protein
MIPSLPFEQGHATPEEGVNQGGPSGLHRADIVSVEAVNRTMTKYVSSNNESGDSRAVATVSRSNSGLDAHNVRPLRSELISFSLLVFSEACIGSLQVWF